MSEETILNEVTQETVSKKKSKKKPIIIISVTAIVLIAVSVFLLFANSKYTPGKAFFEEKKLGNAFDEFSGVLFSGTARIMLSKLRRLPQRIMMLNYSKMPSELYQKRLMVS